jgi:GNAT superfamily N-acetyltransferase
MCFGLYDKQGQMLGFARVVTDTVVFAYLMDFFIREDYRSRGLGSKLLRHILDQPELQVRLWFLATQDAHPLYERFGFTALDDPERYMFKRDVRYL